MDFDSALENIAKWRSMADMVRLGIVRDEKTADMMVEMIATVEFLHATGKDWFSELCTIENRKLEKIAPADSEMFFATEGEAIVAALKANRRLRDRIHGNREEFVVLEGPEMNWAIMTRQEAEEAGHAFGVFTVEYVGPDDY